MLDHRLLQERTVECRWPVREATERRAGFVDVEGRDEDDAGAVADHRLMRIGGNAAHVIRRHLGRHAAEAEHGMQLDRVARDARLPVEEIEERDPGDARARAELNPCTRLRHLTTARRSRARRT